MASINLRYHRISTHAPRTGSDFEHGDIARLQNDFNPRSPHGERPCSRRASAPPCYFNPRSPHGERLLVLVLVPALARISTHAPRTGSDFDTIQECIRNVQFQPTLPARGATWIVSH